MTDLIGRLKAAIDEDERIARLAATPGEWTASGKDRAQVADSNHAVICDDAGWSGMDPDDANHIARHDPAAILRKVKGAREIVELHTPRTHEERVFVSEGDRKDPSVMYEPTGALNYEDCPSCGGRDFDLPRYDTWDPCDTLIALASMFGIDPSAT